MLQIMSYEELCVVLGVTEHVMQGSDVRVKFRNEDELIVSPSRGKRKKMWVDNFQNLVPDIEALLLTRI